LQPPAAKLEGGLPCDKCPQGG